MEALPIDALRVVASLPSARLRLACCSHHFFNLLAEDIEAEWIGSTKLVKWLRRYVYLRISINAPLTIRIIWNTSNYTRELLVNLCSWDVSARGVNTVEFYRCDVVWRWYSRRGLLLDRVSWPDVCSVRFAPLSVRVTIQRLFNRMLLPNRSDILSVEFATQDRLYRTMLQHV